MTSLARPLKAQTVNKGKVWLVFILGAAGLFGAAVLLENNERFFPAISRANKAMAATRKAQQARARAAPCVLTLQQSEGWVRVRSNLVLPDTLCQLKRLGRTRVSAQAKEDQDAAIEAELVQQQRMQGAVEAGLAEASRRVVTPSVPSPVAAARPSGRSEEPDSRNSTAEASASNAIHAGGSGAGGNGHAEAAEGGWSGAASLGPAAAEPAAGRQSEAASSQRREGTVLREVQSGRESDSSA